MNPDLSTWLAAQVKTYAKQEQSVYLIYADLLRDMLRQACNASAPEASVEARAKTISSFAEKALRKRHKYDDPVHQLTDLCGARVITDTKEEVERICQFIRQSFKVDEANSDDKAVSLGASQFGYRSVHFVVQLLRESACRTDAEKAQEIGLERKAEIQVRTGLENAWARLAHDRIYKSPFKVPDSIQREMNRASALLEEADRDFTLILDSLERYSTSQAALATHSEAEIEINTLEMIYKNVAERGEQRQLALRISSVAKTLSDWQRVASTLGPFAKDQDGEVLRELGAAICRVNHKDMDSTEFRRGVSLLEQALALDPNVAASHACLGWSLEASDEKRAREHYSEAYRLKPENPYYLMTYLEFVQRQFGSDALLGPALDAAVEICRKHAQAGIEMPRAQFTEAKLLLLHKKPHAALAACARAVYTATLAGRSSLMDTLQHELRSVRRLAPAEAQGHRWLERLLLLAIAAHDSPARDNSWLSIRRLNFKQPIVLLGGSFDSEVASSQQS